MKSEYANSLTSQMQLKTDGRDGGGTAFAAPLKAALLLSSKPSDHPDAALINKANAHRGFVFS